MKTILVVDLPNDIFIDDCRIEFRVIENVMEMCVASGVKRLKPMPERKKELSIEETIIEHRLPNDKYASSILLEKAIKKAKQRGYNECLDEISGGK